MGEEQRELGVPQPALGDHTLITTKMGPLHKVVRYAFYQKPMANTLSNLHDSATPEGMKAATVSQEIIRRYKNCSRDLHPSVVEGVLRQYMSELEAGGYSLQWRQRVLEAALVGYERMLVRQKEGTGWVNRPE